MFCKKKSRDDMVAMSVEQVDRNSMQTAALITLAQDTPLQDKLKEVSIKIKYFSPTTLKAGQQIDKKIENCLGDIKIALSKAKISENFAYCDELVAKLAQLVSERKSITA